MLVIVIVCSLLNVVNVLSSSVPSNIFETEQLIYKEVSQ